MTVNYPENTTYPTHSIMIWEKEGEELIRYKYDLTEDRVLISKTPAPIKEGKYSGYDTAYLDKFGVGYEVDETTGMLVITNIPEKEKNILDFFLEKAECPDFEGCEELRKQYQEELANIKDSKEDCPGPQQSSCAQARLMKKYRNKIENIISKIVTD